MTRGHSGHLLPILTPRARAGYTHTAFSFANESLVTKANINGADVPPGSLISFVQKVKIAPLGTSGRTTNHFNRTRHAPWARACVPHLPERPSSCSVRPHTCWVHRLSPRE
jgi:hypothetical protein